MKIVIIGAGISGCCTYLALKKRLPSPPEQSQQHHQFTIYEAYPTHRSSQSSQDPGETYSATLTVGGGLGIGPNGLNSLKRLDQELFHDVVRAGYPYSRQYLKSSSGWNLMQLPTTGGGEGGDSAINSVSMSRHAVWSCLRDRIPDDVLVQKRVVAVVARADGRNVIKFADGSPDVEADLVVGADGLKSIAKSALFSEAETDPYPPQYEGVVGIGGFVPSADLHDLIEHGTMNLVFGGNGFFGYSFTNSSLSAPNRHIPQGTLPPGDSVLWWSTYEIKECPDPKTIDVEAVLTDLQTRHASWKDPVIQKIIPQAQIQNIYPVWTTPPLPTWERNGVVLVGDAAHALPPTSGQGTSQALEDVEAFSMLLSHCLSQMYRSADDGGDGSEKDAIRRAAKRYMDMRIPRIQAILKKAREYENKKRNLNLFEEWFMYLMLFIVGRFPPPSWLKEMYDYDISEEVERIIATEMQNSESLSGS